MRRERLGLFAAAMVAVAAWCAAASAVEYPVNVILIIGDGMGTGQVEAARAYYGAALSFESFPYQGQATTHSANSSITDSAAAATALATGVKVNNGVISQRIPGDSSDLETLLEFYRDLGRSTGLVTTTYMTHATPAAFGAHQPDRNLLSNIAYDYLNETTPNVLFGGGANGMSVSAAQSAGYDVVTDRAGFDAIDPDDVGPHSAQFGVTHLPYLYDGADTYPDLAEMTRTALDILDADPDGFFLMIEGGRIDHAGHDHNLERCVFETLGLDNAVKAVMTWAGSRTDTLVIVTADHETGGLVVDNDRGAGNFPDVTWTAAGHTADNVPVYAWGLNAHLVSGTLDNTDIHDIAATPVPEPVSLALFGAAASALMVARRRH